MQYAALISLGCAKNLVDSEGLAKQLVDAGYSMTENPSDADLILINTCGFLESAVQEAIEAILRAAEHKISGRCSLLIAAGCMVQRYGKKLLAELPEVDLFLGTSDYHSLGAAIASRVSGHPKKLWIRRPLHVPNGEAERLVSTAFHTAYLKIAEGCGNTCSFCIIPHLRGPLRSRSEESILSEANRLALNGVKEINLIAQDTTAFGLDRNDPDALPRLLEKLEPTPGLRWIRLLYSYPDRISDRLLQVMSRSEKIVPYLDIPLQHCSAAVLKRMGRPEGDPERVIERIRLAMPHIALRTSVMAGFPGETRGDFHALLRFMERARFDHAGVFAYSPEVGTRAARLPGRPGRKTAESRCSALLELQREISRQILQEKTGAVLPVLIEGQHPETELLLSGRLPTQAPEVDGNVIVTSGDAEAGSIRMVRITASHDYDLEGVLVEE